MATTSPDGLRTPDPGDPYNLVPDLQTLANDTQAALILRANTYTGTSAQRLAFTTAPAGSVWQDTTAPYAQYVRIGSDWKAMGTPAVASDAERSVAFPSPAQGDTVFRSDKGWNERYYALYNASSNPGGAVPAGWYPYSEQRIGISMYWNTSFSITTNSSPAGGSPTIYHNFGGFVKNPSNALVTVPFSGLYRATGAFAGGTAGSALISMELRKNTGSGIGDRFAFAVAAQTSGTNRNNATAVGIGNLTAGDQFGPYLYATVNLNLGGVHSFTLEYLGPKQS